MAPPKTIYSRPANLFVADFIGYPTINLIEGRTGRQGEARGVFIEGGQVFLQTIYKNLPTDMKVVAGIRPENIRIDAQPQPNRLEGEVRTVLAAGPETVLRVRCGGHTFNLLASQEISLSSGARITLFLPPDSILVFDQETGRLITDAP